MAIRPPRDRWFLVDQDQDHHLCGDYETLHQVSKLHYKTVTEIWERTQQGGARNIHKEVPAICILLSKDLLGAPEPGYQPPQTLRIPGEHGGRCRRKFTANKACWDYRSACSPHTGAISFMHLCTLN